MVAAPQRQVVWHVRATVRAINTLAAHVLVLLVAAVLVGLVMSYGFSSDTEAFLRGAELVAAGESPYGPAPEWTHRYLYAPWLAWVLIPATWLPVETWTVLWHTALAVALAAALWPLVRQGGYLVAIMLSAFGFHAVWAGHFEPLMIVMLVYALPTKWGPVAIGVAASLKITPIVLCVRYAGRGEWGKVAVAVLVAGALWAPALLYDLSDWLIPAGSTLSLFGVSPILWGAVAIGAVVAAWRLAPTRYGWLAAAVAWLAVMPRVLLYDVSGLLVTSAPASRAGSKRARPRPSPRE